MAASTCLRPSLGNIHTAPSDRYTTDSQSITLRVAPKFDGLRCTSALKSSQKQVSSVSRVQTLRTNRPKVSCGLGDFFHPDLLGNVGSWIEDVEKYGSVGFYSPPEGGPEGRFATGLRNSGYRLMNVSARGLGDPEAYLTKVHGVRPPHLGKQAVARWYIPPEVDYRLSLLHPQDKGLIVWVGEAKVLAKNELQFLALLPALRPKVKVVAEMGSARKFEWKPLQEISGLPASSAAAVVVEKLAATVEAKPDLVPAANSTD